MHSFVDKLSIQSNNERILGDEYCCIMFGDLYIHTHNVINHPMLLVLIVIQRMVQHKRDVKYENVVGNHLFNTLTW